MSNTQDELLAAVRWALGQAVRQWAMYANDKRYEPTGDNSADLGMADTLEDETYNRVLEVAERLGAAAGEREFASATAKTAFAPAHCSESARRLVLAYCQGRREVIEATIASERLAGNAVKEQAERTALAEIDGLHTWVVRGGLTQNAKLCNDAP